jgi:hypothetical protein
MGQYPANYAEGGAMNQYPDGGSIYTYAKRPGSYYQKDSDGNWLISNKGTGGQYVPIDDPSGQRAAALNKGAVVTMANPTAGKYDNVTPSYGKSPMVQSVAGRTEAERQPVQDEIAGQQFAQKMEQDYASATKDQLPQHEQPVDMMDYAWQAGALAPSILPAAIKSAGMLGAKAMPYITEALGTSIPGMSAVPGATIGNAIGSYTAADAMVNRLPEIPGQVREGKYADATANLLTGALDVGTAGMVSPIYKGAKSTLSELGQVLNTEEGLLSNAQKSIGSKIASKFLPNTTQFIKEYRAKDASTAPLEEAEQWMKEWTSHPATQKKIANSFANAANQPMEIEGLSKMNLTDRMAAKDAYTNNLKLGYEQIANYDPTGKLKYYPLDKQFKQLLNPFDQNIHVDNTGVNYTNRTPPEGLVSPELMSKAEFATNLDHSRMGTWVSRAISDEEKLSTGIHELTHDYGKDFPLEYLGQKKMIDDNIGANVEKLRNNLQTRLDKASVFGKERDKVTELMDDLNYMSTPTEVHARIMELRKQYGIKPDDVVDEAQAQKILNNIYDNKTAVHPRFSQILGNSKAASNIFNNAWMTIPAFSAGALLNESSSPEKNSNASGGFINQYPDGGILGATNNPIPTTPTTVEPGIPGEQETRDFYTNWYSKRTLPFDEIGNKQYEKTMKSILPAYNPESTLLNEINEGKLPYEVTSNLGDPYATGAIVYNKKGIPEKIQLSENIMNDPAAVRATMTHEERTRIMAPYADKVFPFEQRAIEPNIKTFEEGWGKLSKEDQNKAGETYDYLTNPQEDNIQSMLFEVRRNKNLQPDQIITDEDIQNWKSEAEKNGALDRNNPNYDPALYNLFKLSKDNSSMKNLFNYIASNNTPKANNMNMLPTYGGNFT